MVGLVKYAKHKLNANDKPLTTGDFDRAIAQNPIAPMGGVIAPMAVGFAG